MKTQITMDALWGAAVELPRERRTEVMSFLNDGLDNAADTGLAPGTPEYFDLAIRTVCSNLCDSTWQAAMTTAWFAEQGLVW
jgi:hypothetical protein